MYIKGCATEDYSDVLGAAEYIDGKFLIPVATYMPLMCDLEQYSIVYSNLKEISCVDLSKGKILFHMTFPYREVCDLEQYSICSKIQKTSIL